MLRVHWLLPSLASVAVAAQVAPAARAQSLDPLPKNAISESSPLVPRQKTVAPPPSAASPVPASSVPVDAEWKSEAIAQRRLAQVATIDTIDISLEGNQVLVRADGDLEPIAYWDRQTLAYQIEIRGARLASGVQVASARDSEAIAWIRANQAGPETVIVQVMPAPQVSVEGVNQPSSQAISLTLRPYSAEVAPPPVAVRPEPELSDRPVIPDGKIVIAIDPGHGGRDPGAVGIGGLSETDIVNPMSHRIKELLEQQGVRVVLTRETNRTVDLEPRVQLANRLDVNLFVSIHANAISMSRPDVNGVETYYYQTGGELARVMHSHLLQATGGPDRGVRTARFYVLRNTRMPAVLLELGFVTGAQDAPRLANPAYRERLSQAIARGILQYVRQYCPGSLC